MKGLIQGHTFQTDKAGTHPNSRSNAPAEKNTVLHLDSSSHLWSRGKSAKILSLVEESEQCAGCHFAKGGCGSAATNGALENLQPP